MTTEFQQPINPIRIWTKGTKYRFAHPVFAIAISNSHDVEYLTINGQFVPVTAVNYAEVLLNGQWTPLEVLELPNPRT